MSIKVLYVDDEINLGKIVSETLQSRGFEVTVDIDGENAIRSFEKVQPDICLLDIMLPNRSGFELATEIRRLNQDVPIIFLTAKTQTADVLQGFERGGNDYMRKPFSLEELIARMENLLRIRQIASVFWNTETLTLGKYHLDLSKQELSFENSSKKLSYREMEILKYLWKHRVDMIDRKELLLHIWGDDSYFNSRNLDVYINKLRKYLEKDPKIEILTVKGVGYRFVAG